MERTTGKEYKKQYKKQSTDLYRLENMIADRAKFLMEQHPDLALCKELKRFWDIQNTMDLIHYIQFIEKELDKNNTFIQKDIFEDN